jgi:hypothetical protein
MTSRPGAQPADEWTFVRQDDEVETDEPVDPSPELAALHIEQMVTPARDAGRTDVALGDPPDAPNVPEIRFDDEQPEQAAERESETETDLEEILESQHFSFEDEASNGNG